MFNDIKSAVLGSSVLTLVGVIGLVFVHSTANASAPPAATFGLATSVARDEIPLPPSVVTLSEVKVEAEAPKAIKKPARAKQWKCGSFEDLQNDPVQKVRRCEWK